MSRKRSKALDANHADRLSRKQAADAIRLDDGLGLAAVAAQLAALEETFTLLNRAGMVARNRQCKLEDWRTATPEQTAASKAERQFEEAQRRSHDMTDTLQELLLQMEPRTLDETLSLSLVCYTQMLGFLNDTDKVEIKEGAQVRMGVLERGMQAILRGLIQSGASSPLLK
jgi:transketolase